LPDVSPWLASNSTAYWPGDTPACVGIPAAGEYGVGAFAAGATVVRAGDAIGICWQPASPAISARAQIIFLVVVTFLLNKWQ
jgi:hypothetical protein